MKVMTISDALDADENSNDLRPFIRYSQKLSELKIDFLQFAPCCARFGSG